MTNTILRRAATLAAAFCAALALSTPALALDVQIQEGAAVKFPKGLKWEPMVETQTNGPSKRSFPSTSSSPKEQTLALSVWKENSSSITSKLIKSGGHFYFITTEGLLQSPGCDEYSISTYRGITYCKAKIIASNNAKLTSPVTIDAGTICKEFGTDEDGDDSYEDLHAEIAFDEKNNTIYLRQKAFDHDIKECYRKITLMPGNKISGGAAQNAATPAPASQSQSGAAIAGDITPRKALEALYGKLTSGKPLDGDCKEYASWKPPLNTEKFKDYFQFGEQYKNQPLLVCSKFSASYTEQDKQKFVLVTKAGIKDAFEVVNFGTTDVPAPIIGMAVFVKDGGQWKLEVEDRFVTYTSFSEALKLQKIGANKYGVLSTTTIHSGAGCNLVTVEVLMPYAGGITAQELNVPLTEKEDELYNGDGGGCKATTVSFDTKSRDEYYPVTVKQTFNDGKGRHPKKSARLTFSNGSYVKSK